MDIKKNQNALEKAEFERALGVGLISGHYTRSNVKDTAEQYNLNSEAIEAYADQYFTQQTNYWSFNQ